MCEPLKGSPQWVAVNDGTLLLQISPDGDVIGDIDAAIDFLSQHWFGDAVMPYLKAIQHQQKRIANLEESVSWAQCVLTALNVGDVKSGSPLHKKLREVMIAYRALKAGGGDE